MASVQNLALGEAVRDTAVVVLITLVKWSCSNVCTSSCLLWVPYDLQPEPLASLRHQVLASLSAFGSGVLFS